MQYAKFETGVLALIFVFIWSSAAVFVALGLEYTTPFVFLTLRLLASSLILLAISLLTRAPWPRDFKTLKEIVIAGILLQPIYLGASFYAMSLHTPPALFAIILGMQPMLTALFCHFVSKDHVRPMQWFGLALGFAGLVLVTFNSFAGHLLTMQSFFFLVLGLLGITFGTIYQKQTGKKLDHRTTCTLHNLVGLPCVALLACFLEPSFTVHWTWQFVLALGWMVVLTSVIAFILLYALIQRGDMTKVSSLFYLMPPGTAIFAYIVLGETLQPVTLVSLVIISLGIFFVNRSPSHGEKTKDSYDLIKK